MVYTSGDASLQYTGLNLSTSPDFGFAALKASILNITSAGVDVLLSVGGWDFNCYPYAYTRYSVGGYGPNTPNYWEIQQYCGGDVNNASPANEYCYTCEPPSSNETLNYFDVFPEPSFSPTWQQAIAYVSATAGGSVPPAWDTIENGEPYTDPATGISSLVPGSNLPWQLKKDPYAGVVMLAKDLGCTGVDVDYEEFWHADMHKLGDAGPWELPQTVYKYAAVLKDIEINVDAIAPGMLISTAAGAVGGWAGNWWGGNMKSLLLNASTWYPDLIARVASTGGVNVMTYDLSDDESHYECPTPAICTLHDQVDFYMAQYATAGIAANVGYETGTPAYPSPTENPAHQLPLTLAELATITAQTQTKYAGGFFWEMLKQPVVPGEATPTQVAQAICNTVLPGNARCSGTIPVWTPPTGKA